MMLLPKKVGPFTLMRRLGADGATESYTAILDEPAGKQVVARRIEPWLRDDPRHGAELEARVRDLQAIRHPALISTLDYVVVDGEHYILSDWVDGVSVRQLLFWCRTHRQTLPHNIYLDIATRVCNGLEALNSRPGAATGGEHVLHLGLSPECVILKPDGGLVLGVYGLVPTPTVSSGGAAAGVHRVEYLSPEQTHPDQPLGPASDIFSLGTLLYEMLTLDPLFKSGSRLATMQRIRKAEVTTQLLQVKQVLPGLDKILYRSLSLNPRHRYQRAFVLREDLRGLMAGYSFADIEAATRDFLAPLVQARLLGDTDELIPHLPPPGTAQETTDALLENSAQDFELRPGLLPAHGFVGDDTAAVLRGVAPREFPELLRAGDDAFVEHDTGALLRQANRGDLDGVDGAPADPDTTDVEAGAPQHDATDFTRRPPGPASVQPPAASATRAPTPPPAPARPVEAAAAAAPPEPTPAGPARPTDGKPSGRATPAPTSRSAAPAAPRGATPAPASRASEAPAKARTERVAMAKPAPRVDADEDSDLDWRGGGTSPWVYAAIGLVASALVAFTCVGFGAARVVSALGSRGDAVAAVAPTAEPSPDMAIASAEPAPRLPAEVEDDGSPPEVPPNGPGPATRPSPEARPNPPAPSTAAATARPSPPAAPPSPREVAPTALPRPEPAARPEPARLEPAPRPEPAARPEPLPPPPPPSSALVPDRYEDDAVALAELVTEEPDELELGAPVEASPTSLDLDGLSRTAHLGRLNADDRAALKAIPTSDPTYSRARVVLYQDAKARGDLDGRREQLDALMRLPENGYRPELLVEEAHVALVGRDYETALDRAELAERHWARLPPDLMFSRRAAIFEIQAAAWTGIFYASDGEDLLALDRALRVWERYLRHAQTGSRTDLERHATAQLEKLTDIQARLQ